MATYDFQTDKTWAETRRDIELCMERWGVLDWNLTPDMASKGHFGRGVSFRMVLRGAEVKMRADQFYGIQKNARALYLTLDDMRMIERRGLGEMAREAYAQLPPAGGTAAVSEPILDPHAVLGIRDDAPLEIAEAAFRELAKSAHPDKGGSDAAMARLNTAIDAVRKEKMR